MLITDRIKDSISYTISDIGNREKEHDVLIKIADNLNEYFISNFEFKNLYTFLKDYFPGIHGGYRFFNAANDVRNSKDRAYVYQHNGRKFPQYNIALENGMFRFGIAISFQPGRDIPDPCNSYVLCNAFYRFAEYTDSVSFSTNGYKYYIYKPKRAFVSADAIDESLIAPGNFIFFGKMVDFCNSETTWEDVCKTLNELYSMYKYSIIPGVSGVSCPKTTNTTNFADEDIQTTIRKITGGVQQVANIHKKLQQRLIKELEMQYPKSQGYIIETEKVLSDGNRRIDVCLNQTNTTLLRYYEIKCYMDLRSCIREAIGQLLEYLMWDDKDSKEAELYIVTQHTLSKTADRYLKNLSCKYGIIIRYQQIRI